eukprot:Gb_13244 [translate_table: standard]
MKSIVGVVLIVAMAINEAKAWDINFPTPQSSCPLADPLSLNACVSLLGIHVVLGDPKTVKCCDIIYGLGVDASVCLCTAVHLKILGLNVDIPLALKLLVTCGLDMPNGLNC